MAGSGFAAIADGIRAQAAAAGEGARELVLGAGATTSSQALRGTRSATAAGELSTAWDTAISTWSADVAAHAQRLTDSAASYESEAQEVQREWVQVQAEVVDRLEPILRRADDVDADFAALLGRAARGEIDDGSGLSLAAATGDGAGGLSTIGPPENGTPGDNAGWWASLSDEERRALIDGDPGALGNLDGLPATVRDEANRSRLDDERATLEAERDRLQADLDDNLFGGTFTNAGAALAHVDAKLASLDRIERTLSLPGFRQLLVLDLSGERAEVGALQGVNDQNFSGAGCADFPNVGGQSLTLDRWTSEGNLPDTRWGDAVRIVAEVTGEYGFGTPRVVVDRPSDHEITATDRYGGHYLFGTAVSTVLLVSTSCHLPANAHPRAR